MRESAPADGYTLLASSGSMANQMAPREQPGYDLLRDFALVGMLGRSPLIVVEDPMLPDRTLTFLIGAMALP